MASLSETGCKVTSAWHHLPDDSLHLLRVACMRVLWDADSVPFDRSTKAAFLAAAEVASSHVRPQARPLCPMSPTAAAAPEWRSVRTLALN